MEIGARYEKPRYLLKENMDELTAGDGIRALIRLRCGNMEEANKYWLENEEISCRFYKSGWDNLEHYVGECSIIVDWFDKLGNNKKERLYKLCNDVLSIEKGRLLKRLWKEKDVLKDNNSRIIEKEF